jgi:hypothetical protein
MLILESRDIVRGSRFTIDSVEQKKAKRSDDDKMRQPRNSDFKRYFSLFIIRKFKGTKKLTLLFLAVVNHECRDSNVRFRLPRGEYDLGWRCLWLICAKN